MTIKQTKPLLNHPNLGINLNINTAPNLDSNPDIKTNKNTESVINYYNTAHQLQSLKLSVINKMIKNTNDYKKEEYLDLYNSIENIITSNAKINKNTKTRADLTII